MGVILQNKMKFILDIGSSSLRLVASVMYAGSPKIIAEESVLYDGYMDGEFLSPDVMDENITRLVDGMSQKMRKKINAIVVGVPSEFCVCVCKRISRKFSEIHKIAEEDICNLYKNNATFGDSEEYSVINYSAMQFVLDDNVKTLSPIGKKSSSLVMDASYILAKKSFIYFMKEKMKEAGVKNLEFISSALGQAMCCEPKKNDGKPFAVVDCGHISTSVAVYKGEGLALLSSFSMGGGHISSDIMQVVGLNFRDSELIKRKIILTIDSHKNEYYEVCSRGSLIKAPINMTNQVVKSRIEMISKVVGNILSVSSMFKDIDIYLTGDGLSNIKGAKNIMKEITGLNVHEYKIPFDNSLNKYQTSKIGLAKLANIAE